MPVLLVLLDLSAAFDIVDHNVLFSRLKDMVFTMYTRPLGVIAQRYGVNYHLYADDTQLYISPDPDNELNFSSSLKNLEHCIADIRLWMTPNVLRLNDNKNKYYIFGITTLC